MTMGPLRDLLSDLVEKRLWPIAVLLLGAAVAVPFVLAKSPSSDGGQAPAPAPPAAVAPGPPAGTAGEPIVSVADGTPGGAPLGGQAKDPFRQQFPAPKTASGGPAVKTPNGGGSAPGGSGSSGGSGSPGSHRPRPRTIYTIAHVDVRFGKATGRLRTIKDVPRLTPLPSAQSPVVIFLGVRSDEQTAVFMISSDVHAQGDGRCTPSSKDCEGVELKAGQTEILDVTAANGAVTEYELDLAGITLERTTSQTQARSAYARASAAGVRLLRRRRATSALASGLRYQRAAGVLLPFPATFLSLARQPSAHGSSLRRAPAVTPFDGWLALSP
jgi:hypothetical protein